MTTYIRLYLVPTQPTATQQVIDVDSTLLVLSQGQFLPVQSAPTLTLVGTPTSSSFDPFTSAQLALTISTEQTQEIKVCWREPVGTDQFPNEDVITEVDPSGGTCVCGITCNGTDLAYVMVQNVA